MKNQLDHSRFIHSPGSLFVLSTKSTGILAAVSVGLAAAAHPYATKMSSGGLLLSVGALQCCWLGANLAISFLEAPVKFLAPSPSRRNLVDVGRHVFSGINKVEVFLAAFDMLGWYLLLQRGLIPSTGGASLTTKSILQQWPRFMPGLVVYVLESFTFLPIMRDLGARYVEGKPVENAKIHGVYVSFEILKVATLITSTVSIGRALMKMF
ncbi:hypothetical protein BG011_008853 [Mortierella polycephala]|uniref:Uncharacterized protein n=1 Tax=Mortierella polycephala TaxID=41804 RepID=A0A9P6PQB3_9FUNG|nr:hypothetical protein BG011_008853 [Mortierella polycephala]